VHFYHSKNYQLGGGHYAFNLNLIFCLLIKFQTPRTTPSRRKVTHRERERGGREEKMLLIVIRGMLHIRVGDVVEVAITGCQQLRHTHHMSKIHPVKLCSLKRK
jgi:hypothetical protein